MMQRIALFHQACLMCSQNSTTLFCEICMNDATNRVFLSDRPNVEKHTEMTSVLKIAPIHHIHTLGWYKWPVDDLIHEFKFITH